MEEWREKLLVEATQRYGATLESLDRKKELALDRCEMEKKIIRALREAPTWFFGGPSIYIRTPNHKLAHDVVRALRMKLTKTASSTGISYQGVKEGISIDVYGPKEIPGCKLIKKEVVVPAHTETKYELQCNGGEKAERTVEGVR